ncbi:MAG: hypothetical protein IT206_09660 [Fimbriimonadaceae bacterium]|nr:hypothetical protein [Fimbriimonadaceae bacterium]
MYTPPRSSQGFIQSLSPSASGSLPVVGSRLRNRHGIEWIVDGHVRTSSLGTLLGDESELTAYPVIFPQNLSDRFVELLNEVARCTPKVILPLDTMPTVFPARAHPGGHSIDAWSHPEHIQIFIDAEDVSEVVLAHELAHAWIDLVRGIEDNRVWREREDTARYAQVQFMQSYVLDFAVDQVLDEKGFDRSQIVVDWEVASAQLRVAAERGYQPENRREAVFMASHLASALVEESRDRLPVKVADLFPVVSRNLPEIFSLAKGMAQSVLDHFPTDRGAARIAIDQILRSSFAFTDPGLEFESHLIHVEPEINWEMDKSPGWLTGQSVRAKCEIGVAMATVGATSADTPVLNREDRGPILVSFKRPDGSVTQVLPLVHAVMPPDPNIARINEMMEESRLAKARREKMNRMNPNRPPASPGPRLPSTGPAMPNFGPHLPNVPGFRPRSYSPGLARWLTRVRMEEMLAGEHPYGYAEDNPITKTDPTGLRPCKPFEALACYTVCASQGARYTGTCTATEFLGIVDVDCHCQPLLPNCGCDAKRLGQLMLQIALTCSVPRKCGPYLAAPPDKKRCPAIIANITLSLGCIYAQDALNKECFGGGDPGHKQKIKEAWNTINTCTKALAFNGCGPYPR